MERVSRRGNSVNSGRKNTVQEPVTTRTKTGVTGGGFSNNDGMQSMTNDTFFLAIFDNEKMTVQIEYQPLENGLIFIMDIHVTPRLPATVFEQRKRRRWQPLRAGINADPRDEA